MFPAVFVACLSSSLLNSPGLVARIGTSNPGGRIFATSSDGLRHYAGSFPPCGTSGSTILGVYVCEAKTGRCLNSYKPLAPGEYYSHLELAPDGLRIVVTDWNAQGRRYWLRIIHPDTGRVIREGKPWTLPKKQEFRSSLHDPTIWLGDSPIGLHPDGETTRLLDPETGQLAAFDPPLPSGVWVRAAPDERSIAAKLPDGSIRIYDLPSRKQSAGFANPGDELEIQGFTHDGRGLNVWVRRGKSWAYEARTSNGKLIRTMIEKQPRVGSIVDDPTGQTFAFRPTNGEDNEDGPLEIRDAKSGREITRIPDVTANRYSPDGKTIWCWTKDDEDDRPSQGNTRFDVKTGRRLPTVPKAEPIGPFQLTADGNLVGVMAGQVCMWDVRTSRELFRKRSPYPLHREFSTAGDTLHVTNDESEATLWNFHTEKTTPVPRRNNPEPPDSRGKMLNEWLQVTPEKDGWTVRVHAGDKADGRTRPGEWKVENGITPLTTHEIAPGGQRLVMSDLPQDKEKRAKRTRVAILDLTNPKSDTAWVAIDREPYHLTDMAFSPDGRWLAVCGGRVRVDQSGIHGTNHLTLIDLTTRRSATEVLLPATDLWVVRFTPDSRMAVVGARNGELLLIEAASGQLRAKVCPPRDMMGESGGTEIRWSAGGRLFATTTPDERIAVWDVARLGPVYPGTLESAWDVLAKPDATTASAAMQCLAADPARALPLLRAKPASEGLRAVRAVEAVEWMGTPAGVRLLETWAAEKANRGLADEARAALARTRKQ
jgi:WD40 repeat protein